MRKSFLSALAALTLAGLGQAASAASYSFIWDNSSTLVAGTKLPTAASGTTYLTVTVTDLAANQVELKAVANFASKAGFNQGVDHAVFTLEPESLAGAIGTFGTSTHISSITFGADNQGIPPAKDGFDIDILFGQGSANLQGTQTAKVDLTATGLVAADFINLSDPSKGTKYYSVIHVQDVANTEDSSKLASSGTPTLNPGGGTGGGPAPLPASAWGGSALLGLLAISRLARRGVNSLA